MIDLTDKKKVAVVGGTGFIGTHVVEALTRAGHSVMTLGRSQSMRGQVTHIQADLADGASIASLVHGHEVVICLASTSLPGTADSDLGGEVRSHVLSTVAFAQECSNLGVSKFVFASSGGTVYGNSTQGRLNESSSTQPISAYGVSKLAIEHYLRVVGRSSPMRTLSLRIANPYGAGQSSARGQGFIAAATAAAEAGEPLTIWGDGSTARDFVAVDDVADAFLAAVTSDCEEDVLNIGSGQQHSLKGIVQRVERAFNVELEVVYEQKRNVDVSSNCLDISLAAETLGWTPKISMEEGLQALADSFHARSHVTISRTTTVPLKAK